MAISFTVVLPQLPVMASTFGLMRLRTSRPRRPSPFEAVGHHQLRYGHWGSSRVPPAGHWRRPEPPDRRNRGVEIAAQGDKQGPFAQRYGCRC